LYKQSLEYFQRALNSSATDEPTKKVLVQKMKQYSDRVKQLEDLMQTKMSNLNLANNVDVLISQMMDKNKLQQNFSQPSNFGSSGLDPQDILIQERLQKLKANPPPMATTKTGEDQEKDLNNRLTKLSGGKVVVSNQRVNLDDMRDLSTSEQIRRAIMEAQDGALLDSITPDTDKSKFKSEEEEDEEIPKPKKKSQTKKKPVKAKKTKKKKKKNEDTSSSDEDSDSSEDISDDETLKVKDTDDPLKRREKEAMRKMFLDEKEKKAKAYTDFKKNQFK